ncbi:unnamed protein product [Rhizophagus irregularis]|uniref:Uncharacterized protein n=1 Tax=Rhizophagus irregularis TaxID=588596 RepID=A0A915ZQJ6_9GLOM|nr:unnamed protein product [Rhizophagus irregularis]
MSSKNYGKNTCGTPPYVSKIRFENKIKKKPPKICSDCKETSDSVKLISSKANKTEEIIDDFYKNPIRKKKLHKLVIFTTQHCNNNNKYSSSIENIDNESDDK